MKRWATKTTGFTIVELVVVIVVIGIIAALVAVAYIGTQRSASNTQTLAAIKDAVDVVGAETARNGGNQLASMPTNYTAPSDVTVKYVPQSSLHYSGLNNVQGGVLFYNVCKQLVSDPNYSTIHSRDGSQTSNIVMSCDDNVQANSLQITGWDTRTWSVPLTQSQIQSYMASVPADSWWTDKQSVIQGFYSTLMSTYSSEGGSWPVQSFWDPWANQYSGVQKQNLPSPDPVTGASYCISAVSNKYPDMSYIVTADNTTPRSGNC
jgi:prepilin-type N-terminal cleavage/methylation domain-containing protein